MASPQGLFVRHAESLANAGGATSDPAMIPLTAGGLEAAAVFAASYAGPSPAKIAVSPYLRAQQTAAPFIQRFPGATVETWPVQEFTYLEPNRFANTTAAQRRPFVENYWATAAADDVDGPGAESFAGFLARVDDCLARLNAEPGFTVVFCHEMFMKAVMFRCDYPAGPPTPQKFHEFARTFSIPNLGRVACKGTGGFRTREFSG